MNTKPVIKKDFYHAVGFTLLLIISAFPLSVAGIKALNLILGQIQL